MRNELVELVARMEEYERALTSVTVAVIQIKDKTDAVMLEIKKWERNWFQSLAILSRETRYLLRNLASLTRALTKLPAKVEALRGDFEDRNREIEGLRTCCIICAVTTGQSPRSRCRHDMNS